MSEKMAWNAGALTRHRLGSRVRRALWLAALCAIAGTVTPSVARADHALNEAECMPRPPGYESVPTPSNYNVHTFGGYSALFSEVNHSAVGANGNVSTEFEGPFAFMRWPAPPLRPPDFVPLPPGPLCVLAYRFVLERHGRVIRQQQAAFPDLTLPLEAQAQQPSRLGANWLLRRLAPGDVLRIMHREEDVARVVYRPFKITDGNCAGSRRVTGTRGADIPDTTALLSDPGGPLDERDRGNELARIRIAGDRFVATFTRPLRRGGSLLLSGRLRSAGPLRPRGIRRVRYQVIGEVVRC